MNKLQAVLLVIGILSIPVIAMYVVHVIARFFAELDGKEDAIKKAFRFK